MKKVNTKQVNMLFTTDTGYTELVATTHERIMSDAECLLEQQAYETGINWTDPTGAECEIVSIALAN